MKEGATHKNKIEHSKIPASRRDKAKLGYRNHEKTKRTQTDIAIMKMQNKANLNMLLTTGNGVWVHFTKQTQIIPTCHSRAACPVGMGVGNPEFHFVQNEPKILYFQLKNKDCLKNKPKTNPKIERSEID